MARAWILASCSWIGNGGGGSSSSSGGSWKPPPAGPGGDAGRSAGVGEPPAVGPAIAGVAPRPRRSAAAATTGDRRLDARHRGRRAGRRSGIGPVAGSASDQTSARRRAWPAAVAGAPPPSRRRIQPRDLLDRPDEEDVVAERQAEEPGRGQDQDHAGGAELAFEEDRDQRPDVAAAADRRARLEPRRELVDQPGGHGQRPARSPSDGAEPVGDRPAADQEQVDDQRAPAGAATTTSPASMNRTWASAAPTGPHGLAGGDVGRLGARARADRPGRSRPGSGPGRRSPEQERQTRRRPQHSLSDEHGSPSAASRTASAGHRPARGRDPRRRSRPLRSAADRELCGSSAGSPARPATCGSGRVARASRSVNLDGCVRSTVPPSTPAPRSARSSGACPTGRGRSCPA